MDHRSIRISGTLMVGIICVGLAACSNAATPVTPVTPVTPAMTKPTPTVLTIADVNSGELQGALVSTNFRDSVRVVARQAGVGVPGLTVQWSAVGDVRVTPSSITNSQGIATAAMAANSTAGPISIVASLPGSNQSVIMKGVVFDVTASLTTDVDTTNLVGRVGAQPVPDLLVTVVDAKGAVIPLAATAVDWSVVSGPVSLGVVSTNPGGDDPHSYAKFFAAATSGPARVKASIAGLPNAITFPVSIAPAVIASRYVVLDLKTTPIAFRSSQTGRATPPIDTVTAGQSVQWSLSGYDWDSHAIASVGTPSFPLGEFGNIVQITFPTAGTYRYIDKYNPTATGTIVVR